MPVNFSWMDSLPILIADYEAGIGTDDDYNTFVETLMEACKQGPCGVLADYSRVTHFQTQRRDLRPVAHLIRNPNLRGAAVIGVELNIPILVTKALTAGMRVKICKSREEGIAYLQKRLTTVKSQNVSQPDNESGFRRTSR